jgi:hypothetical protein
LLTALLSTNIVQAGYKQQAVGPELAYRAIKGRNRGGEPLGLTAAATKLTKP